MSQRAGLISISTASSQEEITTVTHNKQGRTMTVPILNRAVFKSQLTDGLVMCAHALVVELMGAEHFLLPFHIKSFKYSLRYFWNSFDLKLTGRCVTFHSATVAVIYHVHFCSKCHIKT